MTSIRTLGSLGALLLFGGCGSATMPQQQLTNTQAAIRGAEEAGAADAPDAAYHLQLAKEQLATVERLQAQGKDDHLALRLDRAAADAELAIALANEAETREAAEEARSQVQELREEGP